MTTFQKLSAAGCVLISVMTPRPVAAQIDASSNPGRCASSGPWTDPLSSAHWTSWGVGVTNTRGYDGPGGRPGNVLLAFGVD
jgi:hypothetical protein